MNKNERDQQLDDQGFTEEQKNALAELMMDDEWPSALREWLPGVNVFNVLKLSRYEIRHSNMLAWLLDPSESHGLGTEFLDRFIKKAIRADREWRDDKGLRNAEFLTHEWDNAIVRREWPILEGEKANGKKDNAKKKSKDKGAIDVLIKTKKDDGQLFVVAIENKIDAEDGDGQLEKYENAIKGQFQGGRYLFVYLTPDGSEPGKAADEIKKAWICLPYSEIYEMLDEVLEMNMPMLENARMLIQDYKIHIRNNIMTNDKREEVCTEIYRKHKDAFDLVYKYAEMNGPIGAVRDAISAWIKELCARRNEEYILMEKGKNDGAPSLSFQTKRMNQILKKLPEDGVGSWGNRDVYYYRFDVKWNAKKYEGCVNLYMEFGVRGREKAEDDALERMVGIVDDKPDAAKDIKRFHHSKSLLTAKFGEVFDDQECRRLQDSLSQKIIDFKAIEAGWIQEYNKLRTGQ